MPWHFTPSRFIFSSPPHDPLNLLCKSTDEPCMTAQLWNQILDHLSRTLDANRVDTWFRPLHPSPEQTPGTLTLAAPNRFVRDFLEQHYRDPLLSLARSLDPSIQAVAFTTDDNAPPAPPPPTEIPLPRPT
ncbi:MAG: hypothetical protein GF331_09540, partial [Chitinivibrionales bacterium]|nr:hypothetical protein [Chitinivibrionales bacterium]